MRAFLVACVVALVLAVSAAYLLNNNLIPNSSQSVFSTQGVRI